VKKSIKKPTTPKKATKKPTKTKSPVKAKKAVKKVLNERYCFLIRHGERCDLSAKHMHLVTNKGDACLTPDGIKQATETAAFMKKYLLELEQKNGKVFDEVVLECSPFIRCI
jgi:bisphosphoglycerate-dependent phosphoglycerate mutase